MDFAITGDFDREPQFDKYTGLVRTVATISHRAVLMTRHYNWFEPTEALLERLGPWCTVTEERSEWPNTTLRPPNTQTVHEFMLPPEVVLALGESVCGLYGWGGPLPEDLGFIREDGSVVLYSTTHEEEAGLCLSTAEKELLEGACPWLADHVTWRVPTEAERRIRKAGG